MSRKSTHRDYYVVVTRDAGSMRFGWQIKRGATPMGVKLEDHNLASYDAARAAGKRALEELLDGISTEVRITANADLCGNAQPRPS
jgi:hypothetical protein